jgi:hypothetical protein
MLDGERWIEVEVGYLDSSLVFKGKEQLPRYRNKKERTRNFDYKPLLVLPLILSRYKSFSVF